jgi:hypothetical protein
MRGITRGISHNISLGLMLAVGAGALAAVSGNSVSPPAAATEYTLDTSKLARVEGAKETYASPATTIFTVPDSVAATAVAAAKLLAADGWQHYEDPFSARAENPTLSIMTFKKDRQGLSVFVTLAPAQGNATSVSYTANAIVDDLPFPKDASDIKYAPDRPHLSLVTKTPLDASLSFFRDELAARGWAHYSRKENRKVAQDEDASEANERGRFAFFVREDHRPIMLMLQNRDDGRLNASLEGVPEKLLTALNKTEEKAAEAPAPVAEQNTAGKDAADAHDAFDALAGNILKEVRKATDQALSDINKPAPKAEAPSQGATDPLNALAGNSAPVPLPETAEDIDFDGASGTLEFKSASSVKSVAAFYREAMKRDGWKPEASVINKENMVVLRFAKGEQDLSFTIMKLGDKTSTSASGSGLVAQEQTEDANASGNAAPASDEVGLTELTVEMKEGLPLPAPASLSGSEKSLFRFSVNSSVRASVETIIAFYRREIGKLDWNERPGAVIAADHAEISYTTPQGPALLKIERKNGETLSTLLVRKEEDARKAGMLPRAGQTRLMFGNILETDVVLMIDKTKIKIAAGLGSKKPDGPTLELAPGKHKYSLRLPGKPAFNEEFVVADGDVWGLVIGPGGVLPLQMY